MIQMMTPNEYFAIPANILTSFCNINEASYIKNGRRENQY